MKYLAFLILVGIGFVFIWQNAKVVDLFGRIGWAERHLGSAGTYVFYRLLGVFLILLAMLVVTGIGSRMLDSVLGGFYNNVSTESEAGS